MKIPALAALALCLALTLAACGDDSDSSGRERVLDDMLGRDDPSGAPGLSGLGAGLPGTPSPDDWMHQLGKIELTDEMMESYLAIMKALKGSERGVPSSALLTTHRLDMQRWSLITSVMGRAHLTNARREHLASLEKRLVEARARLAGASGQQRQTLEIQIMGYETQLQRLREAPEASDIDRQNLALIQRWKPRLDGALRGD